MDKSRDKSRHPSYQVALSAKTKSELYKKIVALQRYVLAHPHIAIEDIIYSVNLNHQYKPYRLALYAPSRLEFIQLLQEAYLNSYRRCPKKPRVAFLFTGQGIHYYPGMMKQLYESEITFKAVIDKCADIIKAWINIPLHRLLFELSGEELQQTRYTHPALFAVELALAQTLHHYGVYPDVLIGNSVGKYVAAVITQSIMLEDALFKITKRAELWHGLPFDGGMLALKQSESVTQQLIDQYRNMNAHAMLEIALINSANQTIIAGTLSQLTGAWDNLLKTLTALYLQGVEVNWAVFARANGNTRHPIPLQF